MRFGAKREAELLYREGVMTRAFMGKKEIFLGNFYGRKCFKKTYIQERKEKNENSLLWEVPCVKEGKSSGVTSNLYITYDWHFWNFPHILSASSSSSSSPVKKKDVQPRDTTSPFFIFLLLIYRLTESQLHTKT